MKICMMTNTYLPHVGGVARSVATFTEEYRKAHHRVLVVAPKFKQPRGRGTKTVRERMVVRLPAIQQFNGSDFSVRLPLVGGFTKAMNRFKPDIVHSHHPFLVGDTALRYAASQQCPVVFTHHTLYEQYTHYVPFDSTGLKQFVIELSTNYANLCQAVIAPSQSIANLLNSRGVSVPIEVIPTGIDVAAFANGNGRAFRQMLGIPPRAFVVGHVGRLAPEKNLEYLSRAVVASLQRSPAARFLVVGSGPSEDKIKQTFAAAGLEKQLVMAGKRTGQELYDAYSAMNVFVFSSHSETQGMVVAEAMAAGNPVVALEASGVREVVENNKNGIMLAPDAPEHRFATELLSLSSHPLLRRRLSAGARATAKLFSQERSAARALELYERVRAVQRSERPASATDPWTALLDRIEIEWRLISEKAESALNALLVEDKPAEAPR